MESELIIIEQLQLICRDCVTKEELNIEFGHFQRTLLKARDSPQRRVTSPKNMNYNIIIN